MAANPPVMKTNFSYTQNNVGIVAPSTENKTIFTVSYNYGNNDIREIATVNLMTANGVDPYDHFANSLPQWFEFPQPVANTANTAG